jgi:hypothetical protein
MPLKLKQTLAVDIRPEPYAYNNIPKVINTVYGQISWLAVQYVHNGRARFHPFIRIVLDL